MESSTRALFDCGQVSYKWMVYNFVDMTKFNINRVKSKTFLCRDVEFFIDLSFAQKCKQYKHPYESTSISIYTCGLFCEGVSFDHLMITYKITLKTKDEVQNKYERKGSKLVLKSPSEIVIDKILLSSGHDDWMKGCLVVEVHLETKRLLEVRNYHLNRERLPLVTSFESLLKDPASADVTIKTADKEFKAHRAVLAHRSQVFAAMFQPHTREAATNQVSIEDIESRMVEAMLDFIYTDSVPGIEDKAEHLLPVAEKYSLDDLKTDCGNALIDTLSVDNVISRYKLAQLYNCETLLKFSSNMLNHNFKDIIQTYDEAPVLRRSTCFK